MKEKANFHIPKMDCPSEEQLIRMKLESIPHVYHLEIDIPGRSLHVYHQSDTDLIAEKLNELNLGATLVSASGYDKLPANDNVAEQKKLLWKVLAINFFFFVLEWIFGIVSGSMGLFADGLDMLADSFVYGMALIAAGGSALRKKNIATVAGYMQLLLAIIGFAEIIRRSFFVSESPEYLQMIVVSIFALLGNAACLFLLQKSKSTESHMKASMIFTSNDIIANAGVIVAAVVVWLSNSRWPDLLVGGIVFFLLAKGAFAILKLAKNN